MTELPGATTRMEMVGRRITGPRRAVLDRIAASSVPFTAEDLCEALPAIGRATVFRTVKLLHELEFVCRVPMEDGSVRYQLSESGHHHHLVCRECNAVREFSGPEIDRLIAAQARAARFHIESHSLELYGRCESCQAAK